MTWRSVALPALGAALVVLTAAVLTLPVPGHIEIWDARRSVFIALALASGAIYLGACWFVLRVPVPAWGFSVVVGVAIAVRLLGWWAPPMLSSDIFRYVWDGRVQMAGINPYRYIPADPALAQLRDDPNLPASVEGGTVFRFMNRADTAPTIYPPVAQGVFLLVAAIWPGVWPMKLAMLVLEAAAIAAAAALLAKAGRPRSQVLLYAWAPLPVWEFAANGHIDAASLGFLALAVYAAAFRRNLLAGILLGAATLCKFLPIVAAPALWRRWDWRLPLGIGAVIVAGYACYIGAGWGVLGYLSGYGQEEGLSSGGGVLWLRLLGLLGPLPHWVGRAYLLLAAVLLLLLALVVARDPLPVQPGPRALAVGRGGLILAGAVMAAVTPHYPWYLPWLAWLTCLCPARSALCLTALAPLLYWDPGQDQVLWPFLVFVPAALLVLRDLRSPLA